MSVLQKMLRNGIIENIKPGQLTIAVITYITSTLRRKKTVGLSNVPKVNLNVKSHPFSFFDEILMKIFIS